MCITTRMAAFTQQLDHLLGLLVATIFADNKVFASEIDCFVKTAMNLPIIYVLDPQISEKALLEWYETHKDDIHKQMSGPYLKDWIFQTFEGLSDIPNKQPILRAMRKIAAADQNIHISERSLMTLAARHWGIEFIS